MKTTLSTGNRAIINPPVQINSRESVDTPFQAELKLFSFTFCKLKSNQGIQVIELICPTCCKSDINIPENPQIDAIDIAV